MEEDINQQKIWTKDFIFICLANFFVFIGFQMTLPTLPLFVEKLGGNDQLIGLIVSIFTLSALLIRPWVGHALESKGRRFIYVTGLVIFVISVGSYAFLSSIALLFIMRIIQGLGWGMSTTAGGTVATDLIPKKRRGEGMGYFGLSGNLALALGPSFGLILVSFIDFSYTFALAAIGGLLALGFALVLHYRPVAKVTEPHRKWDVYEKTALKPASLMFFMTMCFGGIASFLPLYANQKGIGGIEWYFIVYAIALMASRTFSGRLYDLKGHQAVFIPGAVLIIAAMLCLAYLGSFFYLILGAVLFGLGFGAIQPAMQAWAIEAAPMNRKGMANATFFSFFDLGVGFGALFFGFIASHFGYGNIYVTAACSVAISVLLYLFYLYRDHKHDKKRMKVKRAVIGS
ncbi:MFS transporter [Camelliibacillus cellulosilyticus]|uniref:MFS transporter n=1 Tax=Camelliibacillus cellulosilyticus TaxID=2174486 RepID=A0ABV9GJI7_9BACL